MTAEQYLRKFRVGEVVFTDYLSRAIKVDWCKALDICDNFVRNKKMINVYVSKCPECYYNNPKRRFYSKEQLFRTKIQKCRKCGKVYDSSDGDARIEAFEVVEKITVN